jgi:CTD small phosphatase-like protein 2
MIYTCNQKGNIGYSSSKVSSISKKLFTPIQLSPPILSETIHDKENSLPNTPIQIKRKKKLKDKDLFKDNQNHSSKEVYNRSKSRQLKKSLQIFNENFDDLVNTIKNNRRNNTINPNITIEKDKLIRSQTQLENDKEKKEKRIKKLKFQKLKTSSIPINNNLIFKKTLEKNLQDEAKSMTNTIEIANFYEYTKNCMRIIVELKENKSKASKPNKVKILNPDNNKKLAVFDLDETLIHGVVNINNYNKLENIISITLPSKKIAKIGVNVRPHWKEAIEIIKKKYTIVIYTASHSSYANAVLNFLDPENKYFYNRLYRSNCIDVKLDGKTFYIKDMNIFEGFDLKDILIVDNSVMSFAYDLDNGIPILPYYDAEKDFELLFVAYYFESLYNCDDLRVINKQYMKLDYYLNQAIEEYKRENEEEEEEEDEENDKKKESNNEGNNSNNKNNDNDNQIIQRRSKEKEKGISAQNMVLLRNERNKKNRVRRKSQFVEQLQFDFNELRNKFSRDEEI